MKIPSPVIAVVADELQKHHNHDGLNRLFMGAGAPGESPEGNNKQVKCAEWLRRVNASKSLEPLSVLGRLLENYMEVEIAPDNFNIYLWQSGRERVERALANAGLAYHQGG